MIRHPGCDIMRPPSYELAVIKTPFEQKTCFVVRLSLKKVGVMVLVPLEWIKWILASGAYL